MAAQKGSELASINPLRSGDFLLVIRPSDGAAGSKRASIKNTFGIIPANTVFTANVDVRGNRFKASSNVVVTKTTTVNNVIFTLKSAPSTNNATTEGWSIGEARFSNTYLYIAVNATTIKRVALSAF